MKATYLLIAILIAFAANLSFGFGGSKVPDAVRVEPPPVSAFPVPETLSKLAWSKSANWTPAWDKALREAISKANLPLTTDMPCKNTVLNECYAQLAAKMTEYESGFNPKSTFEECSKSKSTYDNAKHFPNRADKRVWCMVDGSGAIVTSAGLFQISTGSANGSRYKCNVTLADLKDPLKNIDCYVKISSYWAKQDGTLVAQPKKGFARYWSVWRKSSGSYAKNMAFADNL